MQTNIKDTAQKVIIFPMAVSSFPSVRLSAHAEVSGLETINRPVWFLFSVMQVEDIIREISLHPVPFSPPYTEGIAQWQEYVLPIISLEKCLGLETQNHQQNSRLILIRDGEGDEIKRGVLRVSPPIRMLSLPFACTPVSSFNWIPRDYLVRAVYEWQEGYLIIIRMGMILNGEIEVLSVEQ